MRATPSPSCSRCWPKQPALCLWKYKLSMAYGIREESQNLRHFQEKWILEGQGLDALHLVKPPFLQWWAGCRGHQLQMESMPPQGFVLFSRLLWGTRVLLSWHELGFRARVSHSLFGQFGHLPGPWDIWKGQWEPTVKTGYARPRLGPISAPGSLVWPQLITPSLTLPLCSLWTWLPDSPS